MMRLPALLATAGVVVALAGSSSATGAAPAAPRMLGVFGDSMVLQHDEPLIHGCGAAPHAKIAALA